MSRLDKAYFDVLRREMNKCNFVFCTVLLLSWHSKPRKFPLGGKPFTGRPVIILNEETSY
jgi:hypothetical protein